jgi:adenylate cyclase
MAKEIERKFLVASDGWRAAQTSRRRLCQFYLARGGKASIRIRIIDDSAAFLTIKSAVAGTVRDEYEYGIPLEDARAMAALATGATIEKWRHEVPFAGHVWLVDVFEGANEGLILAEVELPAENLAIELPPWLGREVTHDLAYYNSALALTPMRR